MRNGIMPAGLQQYVPRCAACGMAESSLLLDIHQFPPLQMQTRAQEIQQRAMGAVLCESDD